MRTERGRKLREAFVPRDPDDAGPWVLLAADYSQVELRIMAHLAKDPGLIEAFAAGKDIHASTAAMPSGSGRSLKIGGICWPSSSGGACPAWHALIR